MRKLADTYGGVPAFYVTSGEDVSKAVEALSRRPAFYLDTETGTQERFRFEWHVASRERGKKDKSIPYAPGLDPYKSVIRLIQVGTREGVYVIDWFHIRGHEGLTRIIEDPTIKKWGLNLKFEYKQLLINADMVLDGIMEIGAAAKILGHKSWSLASVYEECTGKTLPKDEQISDWTAPNLTDSQLDYAAGDIGAPIEIVPGLVEQLKERGLMRAFLTETNAVAATAEIELNGMALHPQRHHEIIQATTLEAANLRERVWAGLRPTTSQMCLLGIDVGVNLNSSKALLAELRRAGLEVEATNKEELTLKALDSPIVPDILAYKKAIKLKQAFGYDGLAKRVHPVTRRIHPSVNQFQTDTFRYSYSLPNLQQIPRGGFRSVFIAGEDEDLRMVIADFTAIELVVAAVLTDDPRLLEIFLRRLRMKGKKGVSQIEKRQADPHFLNAALMGHVPLADVTDEQRQNAKPAGYMFLYAGSARRYRTYSLVDFGVAIDEERAISDRTLWFDHYAGVRAWHDRMKRFIRGGDGLLRTLAGYDLQLKWGEDGYSLTQALNWSIQSPAAAGNKRALAHLWRYCRPWMKLKDRWKGPMLTATVHDEAHITAPSRYVAEASLAIEQGMALGMNEVLGRDDLVLVEAHVGQDWGAK